MARKRFSRLIQIAKIWKGAAPGSGELTRLERFAHFWTLVLRSFSRNRCPVRAAALSYTTLLAMIPLLAVTMSVTSSLLKNQGEEKIYAAIDRIVSNVVVPGPLDTNSPASTLSTNEATANAIESSTNASSTNGPLISVSAQKATAKWIHQFIENTRSGTIGGIGMLLMVFVAIRMLSSIEATFNDIWGITRGRSWVASIVLYWTTISLGPLLIIGALGLAGGAHAETARRFIERMPFIGDLIFKLVPVIVVCLVFTMIYLLLPNTKVKIGPAFAGALVGGTLWHLNGVFGYLFVSRVMSNSKIYGSLGLVPVFMAGVYLSWLFLLFGAQVAYAVQNREAYLQEKLVENVNQRGREFLALRLMTLIGQRFQNGEPPVTLQQISAEIGIPSKLAQQILQPLLAARLVTEIVGVDAAFTPARPLDDINAHLILRAMRTQGQETATRDEPVRAEVLGEFARIEEAERDVASRITVRALVDRAQKQIEDQAQSKVRSPKSKT